MSVENDEILDPAHDPDSGVENVGAVGVSKTAGGGADDKKDEQKSELKVSEDGNIAEHNGVKYVRQEALHNERQERQKLAKILGELDPVMPEFEEFLKQRGGRREATVERTRASAGVTGDYTDDELEGFAVTRGYFKDDNTTPDLARAQRELDIITGINKRQTKREVEPLAKQSARDRAAANREAARGRKFTDGQPIADDKYLRAAFEALPDEYIADPNISNITQVIAAGLEYLDMRKNGTLGRGRTRSGGGREPMLVERGSGRYDGDDGELSGLSLAAARARGKSPEQWAKLSKQVNGNRRNSAVLEDVN